MITTDAKLQAIAGLDQRAREIREANIEGMRRDGVSREQITDALAQFDESYERTRRAMMEQLGLASDEGAPSIH